MSDAASTPPLAGVLPVFQTPYHEDETIDFETLEREIDWLFEHGADGIVMAMVSEVLRLSNGEREQLATHAAAHAGGRGAVVVSVGAESSRVAERHTRHAEAIGATAVMAIPPVATAASEAALGDYYRRILEASPLPVIVQDASGYVGRPMSIAFQAALLEEYGPDRVLFKPEASPIGPRLSELRDATEGKARVFEGTGGIALVDSFQRGVVGTMPGADLIRGIVPLWRALEAGDFERARGIHAPLSALIAMQTSLDGFLAVEKHLLVRQGVFQNEIVRGPRGFELDSETRREVNALFDRMLGVGLQ
ncbi:MAG: dihydrodipicolinate synthase family protein [Verrucomicrobiae bacterium]|nr:dihydrodipicolinate synthase family protein [Verrucomicrobiae bacterium]MCP5550405.1 dihydrodipicolinate synthase family protein [Akkermansiaceae bacterium]